jgi:hypothetical protein
VPSHWTACLDKFTVYKPSRKGVEPPHLRTYGQGATIGRRREKWNLLEDATAASKENAGIHQIDRPERDQKVRKKHKTD